MNNIIKITIIDIFWFFVLLNLNTFIECSTDACNNSCEINQYCSIVGECLCKNYLPLNKTCNGLLDCDSGERCVKNKCYDLEKCVNSNESTLTIKSNVKTTSSQEFTTIKQDQTSIFKNNFKSTVFMETTQKNFNANKLATESQFLETTLTKSSGTNSRHDEGIKINYTNNKTDDKKEIKSKCDFHRHCGVNEVCPQGFCECEQNYRKNHEHDCIRFKCNTDLDCNEHDSYSYCRKNQCHCRDESYNDYQTGRCIPIQNCSSGEECHNNQTCQKSICKCKLNYKWNFTARRCVYSGCEEDVDCFISVEHSCKCLENHNCSCNKKTDTQVEQNKSINNFENKFNVSVYVIIFLILQIMK